LSQTINNIAPFDMPEDLKKVVDFHGHFCPGIMIGYRAAKAGMKILDAGRSEDEELVAIVENDSCAVDAVQVLTGATFGKGNFFFKDHGKQVYSFILRPSGKGVRLSLKAGALGDASHSRDDKSKMLMEKGDDEIFSIEEKKMDLPDKAAIHQSVICSSCGEPTMATRVVEKDGKQFCIPCS
jgi:formylmethanofuran dehydrogenase subunit E